VVARLGVPERFALRRVADSNREITVKQLSPDQKGLVSFLAGCLGAIRGIQAVVLGGSHARGCARPGSDVDLGLLYSEAMQRLVRETIDPSDGLYEPRYPPPA
jgi:hypothetical protein